MLLSTQLIVHFFPQKALVGLGCLVENNRLSYIFMNFSFYFSNELQRSSPRVSTFIFQTFFFQLNDLLKSQINILPIADLG